MSVAAQTSDYGARMSEYVEDLMDRARQKSGQLISSKYRRTSELSDDDRRIKKIKADMTKMSADVKELQLLMSSQQSVQNWNEQSVQQSSQLSEQPFLSSTRRINSAGKGPVTGNFSQISQQGTQPRCWDCGILGHTRRNCHMRSQDVSYQRRNVRCSSIRLTISRPKSTSISRIEHRDQVSAGESTAALQQKDPEIGPILRLLLRRNSRP